MTEEKEGERPILDVEWELQILKHRTVDILGMIEELKARDRSLNARISRLKQLIEGPIVEEEEELEEEEERGRRSLQDIDLHKMSVSQIRELLR